MRVDGVGLVTDLQGTGHCPTGYYRNLMEQELLKHSGGKGGEWLAPRAACHGSRNPRQSLQRPRHRHRLHSCRARKGDRFDVNIRLAEDSKATSLVGGYLQVCTFAVYKAEGLSPSIPNCKLQRLLQGHIFGHAKGPSSSASAATPTPTNSSTPASGKGARRTSIGPTSSVEAGPAIAADRQPRRHGA